MLKKNLILLFIAMMAGSLSAQEMQISGGPEFGLGLFEIKNDLGFNIAGVGNYLINQDSTYTYISPGLSFLVRLFNDVNNKISNGFVFRDSVLFITNYDNYVKASITKPDGSKDQRSKKYSSADEDFFIAIMNFDLGWSNRIIISERLQLYADLGINFTIMDARWDSDTLSYYGGGIYAALALQVNLKKTMYLEFGMLTLVNAFSSQEVTLEAEYPIFTKEVKYEDSGRWDLTHSGVYIHIGWRIDLKKLRENYGYYNNTGTGDTSNIKDSPKSGTDNAENL
ncbi:MAG: hypothetical protein LBG79_06260 [Spirochaetaceae bacterium]|jgi:hypothetical protein|nr:hypothetical protein [Spirochaetaceae bacterium]